jgi:hypothetical protein
MDLIVAMATAPDPDARFGSKTDFQGMSAHGAKPTRGDKVGEVRARRLVRNLHGISGR